MTKLCVIVDGYSSGKFYAPYFKAASYECLHVQSKPDIPAFVKGCFCSSAYAGTFVHTTSLKETADWISAHGQPDFVIPGCEIGVNLADELSSRLGTRFQNGVKLSRARRNKALMTEAIIAAGLRGIKQRACTSTEEALTWIRASSLEYPLVVKPPESTSGDGFSLCRSAEDVGAAFERTLNQSNLLNIQNTALLVQEYVQGAEYVVDTVSSKGRVAVTDIIRYQKRIGGAGHSVYEYCDFLPIDSAESTILKDYVVQVLGALGIDYGPAHAEVILSDQGPVLVEVGARPAGCMLDPQFISNAYGHNQIELSALSYVDPEEFARRVSELNQSLLQTTALALVSPRRAGRVAAIDFNELKQHATFVKVDVSVKEGQHVSEPRNLSEAAAIVYLQGTNESEVDRLKKHIVNEPERFITLQ